MAVDTGNTGTGKRSANRDGILARLAARLENSDPDDPRRAVLACKVDGLISGRTVQLGLGDIPRSRWPDSAASVANPGGWLLFELRGDRLVGVPTWKPGRPRPHQWTV